jgi:predicted nucleotidyltransferase
MLAGLALMKIIAWTDRRFERDADDLRLILRHYLDAGNQDRIYTEAGDCFDLLNEGFDYYEASARILGRDIGRLLSDTSREVVARGLSQEPAQPGADALAIAMIKNKVGYDGDYDVAISMLTELRTGISESDSCDLTFDAM